ncbi:hypothetical protein [Candidatus Methylobacter favarea]|nr:hypothetical protein [Candidatus Methylobacter favarea]
MAILDEAHWQLRDNPEAIPPFPGTLSFCMPCHFKRPVITFLD